MNLKSWINLTPLLLIILAGTLLRTWRLGDIPFTHDELSVVFRTGYDSFGEMISEGVMPDVHPAGIQVFMNYWVALFGDSEPAVKIPFIIFGIVSILLVYKLGEEWFNRDVGLASAAFVSAMEYMVMHSQTARPYASGMMFGLLMVLAWHRWLFRPGKHPFIWLIVYVLASALCAYNHYFSLMFAALVGITGLFFVRRSRLLPYLLACAAIFILFIPHLRIFFYQFRERGVEGWLAKPRNDFILEYIGYVFHYSPYVLAIVGGIVLAGILSGQTRRLLRNRYFYISLAWFFIPFLTGFFYSRYVNAVLQFRVLIFYFPFLLFLFTGNLPELKRPLRIALPLLICLVLSLSLVLERQYYRLYYHSRFKEIILETGRSLKEHGSEHCLVIMDSHPGISEYYYERLGIRYDHQDYADLPGKPAFIELLQESGKEFLSLGVDSRSDFVLPNIILDYFPCLDKKIDYMGGNYYLFERRGGIEVPGTGDGPGGRGSGKPSGKEPGHGSGKQAGKGSGVVPGDPYRITMLNGFDGQAQRWTSVADSHLVDTAGYSNRTSYYMDGLQEFGPLFSMPLRELAEHRNDLVDVSVRVRNIDCLNHAVLVLSLKGEKGQGEWTSARFSDYDRRSGEWYTVYHTFRPGRHFRNRDLVLQVYIWNLEHQDFLLDDFRIRSRPGNPVLYGLTEKI